MMENIDKNIIKEFNATRKSHKFLCNAPFVSMNISPMGIVSPCCYNHTIIEDYSRKSITEIFKGKIYRQYRKAIRKGIFPIACSMCRNSLLNREYTSLQILDYDYFKASRIFPNKLRCASISLSNVCNLECVMCNGIYSSCIRKNREKQESLNLSYKHKFRDEIKSLLPEMQTITLIGGEPFLDPVYYEICDDIISINPKCSICVTTNGTILNDRIKQLLDKGNFYITVSFNGVTKNTYETIHVNANFEETQANLLYFGDYMKKNNKTLTINICPLKLNKFEIPDVVRFCNQNNFLINIGKVRGAVDVALFSSTEENLIEVKEFYQDQKFEVTSNICHKNILEFKDLIRRIDKWIELAKIKKDYLNLFDLNTDKIDSFEKKMFFEIENSLRTMYSNDDEVQLKLKQIQKRWQDILMGLPSFFYSNHLYQRLSKLSPILFLEYFINGNYEWLCNFCNEIFYYGLDHN